MTSAIGGALVGWLLISWTVSARATSTITQQSSSAWGSVENGRTVDRGTHTSHTSDVLPDDTDLSVRFGLGAPRRTASRPQPQPEQELDPEPGLRSGFGSVSRPRPQDPVPPGSGFSQQPIPAHGSGQVPSQQPISGVDAINDAYHNLLAQYPNFHQNIGGQYPWQAFPQQQQPSYQGGFYRPWTGFQGQQPDIDIRGSFDSGRAHPQSAGSGVNDPTRQVPVGSEPGFPVQATEPPTAAGHGTPSQGAAPPAEGTGLPSPATGTPGFGAPGLGAPGVPGAGGAGGAYPSFTQSGYPMFQIPDINSYATQLTQRALQNIARGMSPGLYPGAAVPGASGVQARHDFSGGGSLPGQPGVQSQHASVDSFSFQPSRPQPGARRVYPNPSSINFPQYDSQRQQYDRGQQRQIGTDAARAWP